MEGREREGGGEREREREERETERVVEAPGQCIPLSTSHLRYMNRGEFVQAVREFRLKELSCEHRMASVRCGLASIIPLQLLSLFTPLDLDLRVCGLPDINLEYLKVRLLLLFVWFVCLFVVIAFLCHYRDIPSTMLDWRRLTNMFSSSGMLWRAFHRFIHPYTHTHIHIYSHTHIHTYTYTHIHT